jgi:hypothetical protein
MDLLGMNSLEEGAVSRKLSTLPGPSVLFISTDLFNNLLIDVKG